MFARELHRRKALAALTGLAATAAAGPAAAQRPDADTRLRSLLDRIAGDLGGDATPAGAARRRRASSLGLAEVQAFDASGLTARGRVTHAAVLQGLRTEAALNQLFPFGVLDGAVSPYIVHPRGGAHGRVVAALDGPIERREGAFAAIARDLDGETERLRAEGDAALPVALKGRTLEQLRGVRTRAAVAPDVAAAMDRQIAALEARPAPAEPGVWRLRDGDAYFALALAQASGLHVSPEAAHRQGLEAVRRLQARADGLLRGQGLTRGSVAERLRALARNPRFAYSDDAAGKSRAEADMNASLAAIRPRLARAFGDLPLPAAEVRRLSDAEEAAGRQGYRADPPADGSRPGVYWVDLSDVERRPSWSLPSVVAHELLPGHLLQSFQAARAAPHPLQVRYASGYGEGWAIYAEQLADELGVFADDPRAEIGYLQWMLFRFGRLVADTGLHARRWSRERAIAALREIQGDPVAFVSIEEDVDRMIMQPGAAAGGALHAAEIVRLREAHGGDLPRFHAALLTHGPLNGAGMRAALQA